MAQDWPPQGMADRVQLIKDYMASIGHPVTVTSKQRSAEEQAKLFAQGRTTPGKIVTEREGTPGRESKHQTGDAVDFAFLNQHGAPDWGEQHPWNTLGSKAKELGLEWGGDWEGKLGSLGRDRPHVQLPTRANFPRGGTVEERYPATNVSVTNSNPSTDSNFLTRLAGMGTSLTASNSPSSTTETHMPPPLKYKDNVTGEVREFDHEPSDEELEHSFGLRRGMGNSSFGGPTRETEGGVAPGLLGTAGALIGGKTPLGKVGAGIGAAAGTGIGDLYDMFMHGVGDRTPGSEAARLATVGGITTGMEAALPPVLRGIGHLKDALPKGMGSGGSALMGYLFGHPGAGLAAGAAIEAAPKVAAGIDALGTPAGTSAGVNARQEFLNGVPPKVAGNSQMQRQADQVGEAARRKAAGPMGEVPDYLKQENWGDTAKRAGGYVKDKASAALDGLMSMFESAPKPPAAPPSPRSLGGTEVPYKISEDMLPDYSHVKAPSGGNEGMVYPNMSREPNLKYGADVSAAPMKTPNITQTHPTDPAMPWEEHMSRSAPRKTSTAGGTFKGVEVSTPLEGLKSLDPNLNGGEGDPMLAGSARSPRTPAILDPAAQGLRDQTSGAYVTSEPPVGTHNEGLQRFIEAGGTPEGYERIRARNSHPFGPNTVGAAQVPQHLPMSVDEGEGMSLPELDQWEAFKKKTGASDAHLDDWYVANQKGADPNAGLDVNEKVDKLLSLLNPRK